MEPGRQLSRARAIALTSGVRLASGDGAEVDNEAKALLLHLGDKLLGQADEAEHWKSEEVASGARGDIPLTVIMSTRSSSSVWVNITDSTFEPTDLSHLVTAKRQTRIVHKTAVSCMARTANSHVNLLAVELGNDAVDVLLLGHVRGDHLDGVLAVTGLEALILDLGKAVDTARDEHEVGAKRRKQLGRRGTDAARGAGDEH